MLAVWGDSTEEEEGTEEEEALWLLRLEVTLTRMMSL